MAPGNGQASPYEFRCLRRLISTITTFDVSNGVERADQFVEVPDVDYQLSHGLLALMHEVEMDPTGRVDDAIDCIR